MKLYKQQIKKIFEQTKEIKCPAFPGEKVVFNSKGLSHLLYKGATKRSARPIKEIETRIKLLPSAIKVLRVMPLTQEESSYIKEGKINSYWAFEAVVDNRRIKVIVRQVGKGKKHFWSIIPAWRRIRGEIVNAPTRLNED